MNSTKADNSNIKTSESLNSLDFLRQEINEKSADEEQTTQKQRPHVPATWVKYTVSLLLNG